MVCDMMFDTFYEGSIILPKDVKRLTKRWFPKPKKKTRKSFADTQYILPFISTSDEDDPEQMEAEQAEMLVADLHAQIPDEGDWKGETVDAYTIDWAEQVQALEDQGVFEVFSSPEAQEMIELAGAIIERAFEDPELDEDLELEEYPYDDEEGSIFDDENVVSLDELAKAEAGGE
jgi:hypothetical protein